MPKDQDTGPRSAREPERERERARRELEEMETRAMGLAPLKLLAAAILMAPALQAWGEKGTVGHIPVVLRVVDAIVEAIVKGPAPAAPQVAPPGAAVPVPFAHQVDSQLGPQVIPSMAHIAPPPGHVR